MREPDAILDSGNIRLYCGDCLEILPTLEAGSVDAVVTDPPYGINATKMNFGKGAKNFVRGDWDDKKPDISFLLNIAPSVCIWGGNYFSDKLPPTNHWLVWHKKNDGRSFSECELAWTNFGKQVRHLSHHWGGEQKQHPTQKPCRVMEWCVGYTQDDSTILDPFMGSGTTGVACVKTGRKFIGIELDRGYFDIAVKRIEKALKERDEMLVLAK